MSNVVSITGTYTSIEEMWEVMRQRYPNARKGVIALVEDNGDIKIAMRCTSAELALTSVRLAFLTNTEQSEPHPHAPPKPYQEHDPVLDTE